MRAVLLLAAAAVAVTIAQPQQPSGQERPTFRTGANLVRVDATVIDRHGNPVDSLTADDFVVFEDGIPQRIQSFKFVGATGHPAHGDEASLAIRSPEHAAAEAARDEVRVFLIFWDEYHIGPFQSAINARRALEEFVLTAFGPTDLVALMDPLTPLDAIRFTRDRRELADAVHHLQGRRGVYVPTRSAAEEEQLKTRGVENIRAQVTASALEGAMIHLGTLREGRKSIIFVSESLGALGEETTTVMRALTFAASAHNTAVFPFDPRGLGPRPSELLRGLADDSGGRAIINTNKPLDALRQVVHQASAYYLLGYASGRNPTDGRFHRIEVKLRQRDLEVEARKGYWAPGPKDVQRARAEAAAAAPPDINAALGTLSGSSADRRLFDLWIGLSRQAAGTSNVTVAWSARPGIGGIDAPVAATVVATAADGRKCFEQTTQDRRVSFAAPAGTLRVQVAALNAQNEIVDRDTRAIVVPDYASAELSLSVPEVVRLTSPREQRSLLNSRDAVPFAGRDFVHTDRLIVRFWAYWNRGAPARVSARLMSSRGTALATLPLSEAPAGLQQQGQNAGAEFQLDLPLSSVARGEYVIEIDAERGEDHAQALVPLRVVQ